MSFYFVIKSVTDQGAVLGWERIMGVCQAVGKRSLQLAKGGGPARRRSGQARGTDAAFGRD